MTKSHDDRPATGGLTVLGQDGPSEEDRRFLEQERPISTPEFLDAMMEDRREDVAKMIVQDDRLVKSRDASGASAIQLAVYNGLDEILGILLRAEVPLDLHEAAAVGRVERVRELLDAESSDAESSDADSSDAQSGPEAARARADSLSADGFSLLGLAAFFGHPEVLALALERGADPCRAAENPTRVTPLHGACAHRDRPVSRTLARQLLAAGADPNAEQAGGFRPLHQAAAAGDVELIEMLLAAGADPSAETDLGRTAIELARERQQPEAVARLERAT